MAITVSRGRIEAINICADHAFPQDMVYASRSIQTGYARGVRG